MTCDWGSDCVERHGVPIEVAQNCNRSVSFVEVGDGTLGKPGARLFHGAERHYMTKHVMLSHPPGVVWIHSKNMFGRLFNQ